MFTCQLQVWTPLYIEEQNVDGKNIAANFFFIVIFSGQVEMSVFLLPVHTGYCEKGPIARPEKKLNLDGVKSYSGSIFGKDSDGREEAGLIKSTLTHGWP